MKTSDYDFPLPPELIAQAPAATRDGSRMMMLSRADDRVRHGRFVDLPGYLRAGDLLVFNNTRVIPARVFGKKPGTGGRVEFLFLEDKGGRTWEALMRSRRRPEPGSVIEIGDETRAVLLQDGVDGRVVLRLEGGLSDAEVFDKYGHIPLPPYIERPDGVESSDDKERYQTVFARTPGAVAAPTAGLHFSHDVLQTLERMGVHSAQITLHVGIGTFRPVKSDDLRDHVMEAERFEIDEATAAAIGRCKLAGGRVIAVGSTVVRTLENAAAEDGTIRAGTGRTALFIHPPYRFKIVDAILTNFHLPKSTLLMMMSAFIGRERLLNAYAEAVRDRYRFFSYGDCMLLM